MTMSFGGTNVEFVRNLIVEDFIVNGFITAEQFDDSPSCLYEDNKGALDMVDHNSSRTKHICTRYHYIRQLARQKKIKVKKINTKFQCADFLTKPGISRRQLEYLLGKIRFKLV